MRVKSILRYSLNYPCDRTKVQMSINRLKAGTVDILEQVTFDAPVKKSYKGGRFILKTDEYEFYSSAPHLKDIPRDGLVGEWLFYEGSGTTLHDTSGYGNHGTIYGMTWKQLPNGKWVGSFDRVDDYVEVPYSDSLLLREFTLMAWCKPASQTSQNNWSRLISVGIYKNAINLLINTDGRNKPSVHFIDTKGVQHFTIAPEVFEPDVWQFWVGTFKRPELKLYKNGVLVASTIVDADVRSYSSATRIGARTVASEYFNGLISSVRIYNRALTEEEISDIYNIEKVLFT